ncbi:hypothetical protein AeMF1_004062 [Aphanomyces euteiches]|nr:hypothetical protein AeMF1_004062 [Aphanomyces euteiches]
MLNRARTLLAYASWVKMIVAFDAFDFDAQDIVDWPYTFNVHFGRQFVHDRVHACIRCRCHEKVVDVHAKYLRVLSATTCNYVRVICALFPGKLGKFFFAMEFPFTAALIEAIQCLVDMPSPGLVAYPSGLTNHIGRSNFAWTYADDAFFLVEAFQYPSCPPTYNISICVGLAGVRPSSANNFTIGWWFCYALSLQH